MVFLDFVHELYVNTLGDLDKHSCNAEMNHNYDKTFYERLSKENEAKFNCSVPFHPPITSEITGNNVEICNNSATGRKAYNYYKDLWAASTLSPNDEPCAGFDIFLGLPFFADNDNANEAYIKLYIKSKIKVKSVVFYYDFTTLVAEVGGYIGLLLGISLVDLTILCNKGFLKIVTTTFRKIK